MYKLHFFAQCNNNYLNNVKVSNTEKVRFYDLSAIIGSLVHLPTPKNFKKDNLVIFFW